MSLNYNITLLKTIKEPLAKAFQDVQAELDAIRSSAKKPEELVIREMINIGGSLQMVGRPSLIRLSKDIRHAMERIQSSEKFGWDHIRVGAVANLTGQLLSQLSDHVRALERGEKDLAVRMWPSWSQLEAMLDRHSPPWSALFDPDPTVTADQFSALDPDALRDVSSPHMKKLDENIAKMDVLLKASSEGDSSTHQDEWDNCLRRIGEVFDWAYALKHRMGYHAYWLACRARITIELILSPNSDKASLLAALKSAQVELKKFAEDSRKPRADSVQSIMSVMMERWPSHWSMSHQVLSETETVFALEEFWHAQDDMRDAKNQKSETAFVAKQEELIEAIQTIKGAWSKLAAADGGDVRTFLRALMTFLPKYELFPNPGVRPLMESLKAVAQRFVNMKRTDIPSEFSQEVAVALLLIEETIERKGRWSADLEGQAELAKKRVLAASSDRWEELASMPIVVWGPDKRRQQSQDAISKVVSEVLADLTFIEEVCDEYFRRDADEAKSQYETVKMKAFTGSAVLRALGQNSAASVMDIILKCIGVLSRSGDPSEYKREYGMLSVALAGLSSFLSAFEKGDEEAIRLLEPALAQLGLSSKVGQDRRFDEFDGSFMSIQPGAPAQSSSVMPAQERLNEEQARAQQSFDAQNDWTDVVSDIEITECFIEESTTVLAKIEQLRGDLLNSPADTELLSALRRQFHTLKGSGRTALLWGIGEFSRRIEGRLNDALSKKEAYSQALSDLSEFGLHVTAQGIEDLSTQKQYIIPASVIVELERLIAVSPIDHSVAVQAAEEQAAAEAEQARLAAEEQAAAEAEQAHLAAEEQAAAEAEQARLAAEEQAAAEAEQARLAAEEQAAAEAEQARLAAEEQAATEAEQARLAAEEQAAEAEAEQARLAAEEQAAAEAEQARLAAEEQAAEAEAEQARLAAEEQAAVEAEQDRLAAEEQAAEAEAEQARLAAEEQAAVEAEQDRLAAEEQAAEAEAEQDRLAAEEQAAEAEAEQARLAAEEQATAEAEQARLAAEEQAAEAEAEQDRLAAEEQAAAESEEAPWVPEELLSSEPENQEAQIALLAAAADAEELDAETREVLLDIKTHKNNLEDISSADAVDVHMLHWSSHTLASLSRTLGHERFSAFSKSIERKIERCMEDDTLKPSADENKKLKKFLLVLLDKTLQIMDAPRAPLVWDMMDNQAEKDLEMFEFSGSEAAAVLQPVVAASLQVVAPPPPVAPLVEKTDDDLWNDIMSHMNVIMTEMLALQRTFLEMSKRK